MEGVGLGTVIAQGGFRLWYSYAMCFAYSVTTPLGVAIGIGASQTIDPDSFTASAVKGAFNGVAAGVWSQAAGHGQPAGCRAYCSSVRQGLPTWTKREAVCVGMNDWLALTDPDSP